MVHRALVKGPSHAVVYSLHAFEIIRERVDRRNNYFCKQAKQGVSLFTLHNEPIKPDLGKDKAILVKAINDI